MKYRCTETLDVGTNVCSLSRRHKCPSQIH